MLHRYFLAPLAALALLAAPRLARAQTTPSGAVGIGTTAPDPSAALDIVSSSKGLLLPRLTQAQRDAIYVPATGLTIYNTTTNKLNTWNGTNWDSSLSDTKQLVPNPAVTFNTPGQYTYTVPAGVTSLLVDANGASGGGPVYGGIGGRVTTTLAVTPGETLTLYVGGAGDYNGPGGYNGGGRGYYYGNANFGSGGGGATDVRRSATVPSTNLADRLVVAGGGGGAGSYNGGNGGGLTGGSGLEAGGGTQTAGGTGYAGLGTNGSLGIGGSGISDLNPGAKGSSGGGGGYYGGGSGGYSYSSRAVTGAGGGSGYVAASGTSNTTMTTGRGSDGSLTLTPTSASLVAPAPTLDGTNITNVPGTWGINGSSYYYNNGNVGIGTGTPTEKLEIRDGSLQLTATGGTAQPASVGISNNSGSLNLALAAAGGQYSDLAQAGDAVLRTNGKRLLLAGRDGGSVLVSTGPSGSETERLRVSPAGNVGIGTAADASQKLEVAGNVKISGTGNGLTFPDGTTQTTASSSANLAGDITSTGNATTYNRVVPATKGGAGTVSGLLMADGSGQVSAAVAGTDYAAATGSPAYIQNGTSPQATSNFNISGAGTVSGAFTAGSASIAGPATVAGTLGIGTTSTPSQKLEVAGNVKISGTGNGLLFPDGTVQKTKPVLSISGQSLTINGPDGNTVTLPTNTGATGAQGPTGATGPAGPAGTNASVTASNGVSVASGNVKLGGTALAAATDVPLAGNTLTFSGTGNVGLGTATAADPITQKLDVRGNVRLGDNANGGTGAGQAIEWVGPGINTDPVGLYRYNTANDASELRVVVGDVADANDKFSVGRMNGVSNEGGIPTGTFTPTFTVRSDGNVGVGTGAPTSTLQVAGSVAASIRTLNSGTIADTDYTVLVGGNISLPAPNATNVGRLYHLLYNSAVAGSTTCIVTGTFRDPANPGTTPGFGLSTAATGKGITVQSDGTQWWILTRE